jgi:hypothetical protein
LEDWLDECLTGRPDVRISHRSGKSGTTETKKATPMKLMPTTSVRDLIHAHPEAFEVLMRHGMCNDCRHSPPPVPLTHFAEKHCDGNVAGLLDELRAAIG